MVLLAEGAEAVAVCVYGGGRNVVVVVLEERSVGSGTTSSRDDCM